MSELNISQLDFAKRKHPALNGQDVPNFRLSGNDPVRMSMVTLKYLKTA
jgi:hypothetical protein